MAKRKELDIDLTNDDADGIADGVDSTGATVALTGALTSGGTWTASDVGIARIIEIKDSSTVDQSTATFTITGTSEAGNVGDTEDITGPTSGATVKSAKAWYYISEIAITSPAVG